MKIKDFEAQCAALERDGWQFVMIQAFQKYAKYQKGDRIKTIGKPAKT